jgi:hypothetical protein
MNKKQQVFDNFMNGRQIKVIPRFSKNWSNPLDRNHRAKYFVSISINCDEVEIDLPDMPCTSAQREWQNIGAWEVMFGNKELVYSGDSLNKIKFDMRSDWGVRATNGKFKLDTRSMAILEYEID